jgi:hypothetical protein
MPILLRAWRKVICTQSRAALVRDEATLRLARRPLRAPVVARNAQARAGQSGSAPARYIRRRSSDDRFQRCLRREPPANPQMLRGPLALGDERVSRLLDAIVDEPIGAGLAPTARPTAKSSRDLGGPQSQYSNLHGRQRTNRRRRLARGRSRAHCRARLPHSGLIWAARMTVAHFKMSLAIRTANSSGELATAAKPSAASFSAASGCFMALTISLWEQGDDFLRCTSRNEDSEKRIGLLVR